MKKGFYQDWEREWRKLKRMRFFYLVLPVFVTMLSVRIIQVYFHLKLEQVKKQAASYRREAMQGSGGQETAETGETGGSGAQPPAANEAGSEEKAAQASEGIPMDTAKKPVPVPAKKAEMEVFTPEPAGEPADAVPVSSCTVTEDV